DYHTQGLEVPAAFFDHVVSASAAAPARPAADSAAPPAPLFTVLVAADDDPNLRQTQMLGMARRDLYLLPAVGPFEINFFKGIIGLWFLVLLMLGIALTLSTYLSGAIAWLATLFLFLLGMSLDFLRQ